MLWRPDRKMGQLLPQFLDVGKFFTETFLSIFGRKKPVLRKYKGKFKILGNRNLPCRKFAVSVEKLQLPFPPTFCLSNAMQ